MFRSFLSVGGFTLLSRLTGFGRDIALAALLGAGAVSDAFFVAFRLPNQFRAIFGEGAFNTAYVPSYSRVLETEGDGEAKHFASQIFTLLFASQILLMALAFLFTPQLMQVMAPGFEKDPEKFALAVRLTRITFPYLFFITLTTLHSGTLNAHGRFAIASFAPVLLNLAIIGFLGVAFLFPNAGEAASWGVVVSGALQLALLMIAARRLGLLERFARPRWSADVRQFFGALAPAIIGSAGTQIAILADTIIASLLPTGMLSSITYAERFYQLPIGVIGVAAGTVLLPQMSRRLAAGDTVGATRAQNRTMAATLAMSAPFFVAFLLIPEVIMRGAYLRGAFTEEAAANSAAVLAAYGVGLMPIVLIRSAVASFQARGDTTTPMLVSLVAIAINVALKFAFYRPLGAVGLALATAIGAWVNLVGLTVLAFRRRLMHFDDELIKVAVAAFFASGLLALTVALTLEPARILTQTLPHWRNEALLAALALAGALAYGLALALAAFVLGLRARRLTPVQSSP
ncbi:MAG TPA: murein biosynthesis integral membrane protein MurJ [Roseiarcus sp.]|nr:murein biosynthesis integral membrane protein MurJ [Roseiarcus sp.]